VLPCCNALSITSNFLSGYLGGNAVRHDKQSLVHACSMPDTDKPTALLPADSESVTAGSCPTCTEPDFGYMPCCASCGVKYHASCLDVSVTGKCHLPAQLRACDGILLSQVYVRGTASMYICLTVIVRLQTSERCLHIPHVCIYVCG